MTGESTAHLCPKCRCKLLWNGILYRCISCDYAVQPKSGGKADAGRPPRRSGSRK